MLPKNVPELLLKCTEWKAPQKSCQHADVICGRVLFQELWCSHLKLHFTEALSVRKSKSREVSKFKTWSSVLPQLWMSPGQSLTLTGQKMCRAWSWDAEDLHVNDVKGWVSFGTDGALKWIRSQESWNSPGQGEPGSTASKNAQKHKRGPRWLLCP